MILILFTEKSCFKDYLGYYATLYIPATNFGGQPTACSDITGTVNDSSTINLGTLSGATGDYCSSTPNATSVPAFTLVSATSWQVGVASTTVTVINSLASAYHCAIGTCGGSLNANPTGAYLVLDARADSNSGYCSPLSISFGNASYTNNQAYGSIASFVCENGFELSVNTTLNCTFGNLSSGVWSGTPPTCNLIPNYCSGPLPPLANGFVNATKTQLGDTANLTCNDGFTVFNENKSNTTNHFLHSLD